MRTICVLVGAGAIAACAPADETSAASETAGVTIGDRPEPQWRESQAWTVTSEPQLTIGVAEGGEAYELFRISAAARQSDGDFVVADGGAHEVRLYDHRGIFVRRLGGSGSGPGEFRDPVQVLIGTADSIVVWDNASYRITRFDSAGVFAGVQSVDRGGMAGSIDPPLFPGAARLLPDGQLLVRLIEKAKGYPLGRFRPRSGALLVSVGVMRIDTLMFFGDTEKISVRAPWGPIAVVPALARTTVTAAQPTAARVCIGDQEAPAIVCFDSAGARTVIRPPLNPTPVTAQDITTWHDTTIAFFTPKMSEADARRVLAQVPVPNARPPYARLVLDLVGNLWVELGVPHAGGTASVDHLVFDSSGVFLGAVDLPDIEVLEIGDDYVLGIHRDEAEVEYLRMHELVK